MWHLLHLIARAIVASAGVFCVLTAIVLYPNEEGEIQSKLEDFWVTVDDYQKLAISKHAAFMTQIAKLETRLLDFAFGGFVARDISNYSSVIYYALYSSFSCLAADIYLSFLLGQRDYLMPVLIWWVVYAVCQAIIWTRARFDEGCIVGLVFGIVSLGLFFLSPRILLKAYFFGYLLIGGGGYVCDWLFIVLTRKLLRWAGEMKSARRVLAVVFLNLVLAATLVGPAFIIIYSKVNSASNKLVLSTIGRDVFLISLSRALNAVLSLLFVLLAAVLLVHRALWPLLTRTLFRIANIDIKGRRAILTTVGFALFAAGISGKIPELLQKLIEHLGG